MMVKRLGMTGKINYSEASFSCTCFADGLVIALPSEKTRVGTV